MSVETVKEVVAEFLSNRDPTVLVIKGSWGVGKTHMWNDILTANQSALQIPQYSYASLFGQKSISDLRTALVTKSIPKELIGKRPDWKKPNKEWTGLIKLTIKRLAAWIDKIKPAIPYIKDLSVSFDSIAGFLLKDSIICLDDFERTSIPSDELLGFVSELKTERGCKVVLIFNDEKLSVDQKSSFKDYREKVVDIELAFQPTAPEAADIAVLPNSPHAILLREKIITLNIKNIRLIKKILSLIQLLDFHINTARPEIQEQVVTTAVLMTWVHYGEHSPSKPSIEFVRAWNSLGSAVKSLNTEDADKKAGEWESILNGYGYTSTDELDLVVDQVIERGYWQGTQLAEQIVAQEQLLAASESQRSFEQAWEIFHGSFEDNEAKVIEALSDGLRKSVLHVSPMNLNGTIEVLRKLGKDELADELIDFYIDQRKDNEALFNLDKSPFGSHVTDSKIRARFEQKNATTMKLPSLREAVMAAERKRGWSQEDDRVMKAATVDEIHRLIMDKDGVKFAEACAWISTIQGWEEFRDKMRQALTLIADTSPLNAARVSRFGVSPTIAATRPQAS